MLCMALSDDLSTPQHMKPRMDYLIVVAVLSIASSKSVML